MNNLAIVILDGNLVQDPESKTVAGGKTVTTFSVATNHEYRKREKDEKPFVSFFYIECWDRLAENCAQYLSKGNRVTVEGSLRQDRWTDDTGKNHSRVKIVARSVRFDSPPKQQQEAA